MEKSVIKLNELKIQLCVVLEILEIVWNNIAQGYLYRAAFIPVFDKIKVVYFCFYYVANPVIISEIN